MNKDKKIEELYKLTFREVHASSELKGMVSNMADNKKIVWKKIVWKRIYKKAATAAAVVAIAFVTGNIATYAATGNDLVSYVTLKLNGKNSNIEKDIKLEKKTDKDGKTYYKGHTENENSSFDVELYDVENLDNYSIDATEYTEDKNGTKEYNVTVGIETKKEKNK